MRSECQNVPPATIGRRIELGPHAGIPFALTARQSARTRCADPDPPHPTCRHPPSATGALLRSGAYKI